MSVVRALKKQVRRLPAELRKSLTWDRGMEMAAHKKFAIATDVQVYFCDPQAHGNGERMRTPIASYVSTSRRALICRIGHKRIWAALPLD